MKLIKRHPLLAAIVVVIAGLALACTVMIRMPDPGAHGRPLLIVSATASAILSLGCFFAARVARKKQREKERPARRWFTYLLFALFFLVLAACLVILSGRYVIQ